MKGPFERLGIRWWIAEGQEVARVLNLARDAVAQVRSGALANQKDGRRKELYDFAGEDGALYLLKSTRYAGAARWRRRLTGSKARQELRSAEAVAAREVPTPVPLAAGEELHRGRLVRCWNLIPRLPGVIDLRVGLREGGLDPAQRRRLAGPLGAFAAKIHAAGIDQDDFSPNNFLVRPGDPPELWMIDFERTRLGRALDPGRRAANLAKLARELTRSPRTERVRFLRGYAPGRESEWWTRIDRAARERAAADRERLRRTCLGEGRRFARIQQDGVRGHRRGDDPGPPLSQDLAAVARAPEIRDGVLCVPLGSAGEPVHWVSANLLFLRELAPRPVAYWQGSEGACLAYAAEAGLRLEAAATTGEERGAVRTLRRHLDAIGVCTEAGTRAGPLVFGQGPRGELRALCCDPRGFLPGGSA